MARAAGAGHVAFRESFCRCSERPSAERVSYAIRRHHNLSDQDEAAGLHSQQRDLEATVKWLSKRRGIPRRVLLFRARAILSPFPRYPLSRIILNLDPNLRLNTSNCISRYIYVANLQWSVSQPPDCIFERCLCHKRRRHAMHNGA